MDRYETTIQNKRMFVIYSVGGQAGILLIGYVMVAKNHLKTSLASYSQIQLNYNDKIIKAKLKMKFFKVRLSNKHFEEGNQHH